ncbi:MFS transporter [Fervidicella metallireducens AeB]|uniref:MFS transporter n=1 Tax=Fervidicella metallireducens AeB TaxID=1403537 RepID=A0A017RSG4_9CLOT|nr:MFS transporter [Fervidicella metallireducens]EYE87526.1 MFS transporter [Fervidicella metallireducens AeB]
MDVNENMKKSAYKFIFLIGIVSLFSDFTYEGARSIIGPYLGLLGASSAAVGFVSGLGEFIGYAFRIVTGIISDKTKNYWTMTIIGYGLNLIAIPLLAFVPEKGWIYACGLILLERLGKAIRNPSKNTLVSFAASQVGAGKGFALQEALDQIGAFLGPVMLFIILTLKGGSNTKEAYGLCFLALGITAILAVLVLLISKKLYPTPESFDKSKEVEGKISFELPFWLYIAAISLVAAGFADFPIMSFHLVKEKIFADNIIPILYSLAMGVDAVAALFFGWLYDKKGISSLIIATAMSAFFAPLVFLSTYKVTIIFGIMLWGIGMGAQESILKATVTNLTSKNRRATAFGIFNTGFGLFWFLGSYAMGILYGISIKYLVLFSIITQAASIPLFYAVDRKNKQ